MIIFKIDILKALKENGYNTTYLRKNKILSESTIQKIRNKDTSLTLKNLDVICSMLEMQPGDVVEYVDEQCCIYTMIIEINKVILVAYVLICYLSSLNEAEVRI